MPWQKLPGYEKYEQWVVGLAIPLCLVAYGIWVLISGEGKLLGGRHFSRSSILLHGLSARMLGIESICIGLFLHCECFWKYLREQAWFAELGKIISLVGIIGALGVLLFRVGVLGRMN